MDPDSRWVDAVSPAQMRTVIERFIALHGAVMAAGCPLERWLGVLDEAENSQRNQTQFVSSMDEADQRKAHDLIEARRLAWSLAALYAPGRRPPDVDKSFVTDQLLAADDPQAPDLNLRMPGGTLIVHLAARLHQAEVGRLRICGAGSRGVDLIYKRSNGGVALVEQKDRAYHKSRPRDLESLVTDIRSRVFAAAEGLQAVTNPPLGSDGKPIRPPLVGARVVLVGTSPSNAVGADFYESRLGGSIAAKVMSRCERELAARGASFTPHMMMVFCVAHDIEPTTMVSAVLGRFIDFGLVGGDACDEHWKLVEPVFRKTSSANPP